MSAGDADAAAPTVEFTVTFRMPTSRYVDDISRQDLAREFCARLRDCLQEERAYPPAERLTVVMEPLLPDSGETPTPRVVLRTEDGTPDRVMIAGDSATFHNVRPKLKLKLGLVDDHLVLTHYVLPEEVDPRLQQLADETNADWRQQAAARETELLNENRRQARSFCEAHQREVDRANKAQAEADEVRRITFEAEQIIAGLLTSTNETAMELLTRKSLVQVLERLQRVHRVGGKT